MDQAAVYIILLNWNSAADTLRCLRALTLLRGVQARVVVVDNGSEPADLERLRSGIARWGLAVELVETGENLGFGGGCNVGMRLTLERGAEFVWLLNNDAVPHPEALQAMLRVMARDGEVAAVGGGGLASALVQPRACQPPQGLLCHRLLPPVFVAQCAGDGFRVVGPVLRPFSYSCCVKSATRLGYG